MEPKANGTAAALQLLSQRLPRQLEASMHACAHCGLCNDSCHYYVSLGEPQMVPTYKADRLRNVWKRRYDWLGRVWPWYVGGRDLDGEVIQELWDTAWGACTMCGRCVFNCPFGVDTRLIIGTARAMLGTMGLVPQGLKDTVDIHLQTKNNMGVSYEDFVDTIEWLDEELCDELEVEGPVIPLDKQGARVLYLVNGRFRIGTVAEVMTTETLSELYEADIQVIQVGDRYVVVGEHLDHSGHTHGHTHE